MAQPKVSVIVPVYNTEEYLESCLRSLLGQSLEEIEIIAIDDGSTDGSLSILKRYEAHFPEKLHVYCQENRGQGAARNVGIRLCKGEYVGFFDSDDIARKEMFQKLYETIAENDADYVACGYTDMLEKNGRYRVQKRYVASDPARTQKEMFIGALVSPCIHLYRRSILRESGVLFAEGSIYEDISFFMELIPYLHRLAEIPEPLFYRRLRAGSTMRTISKERVEHVFPVIKEVVSFYREHGFWQGFHEEVEYMCVRILACSSLRRAALVSGRRERKEIVQETFAFAQREFPNFRKNRYMRKGLKHLYLRTFCAVTAQAYMISYHLLACFGRQYL